MGIAATQIEHFRDSLIDGQIAKEKTATASLDAQQRIYAQLEGVLGEKINRRGDASTLEGAERNDSASAGLSRDLDHFFNSVLKFSASPTELSNKEELIAQANILVDRLHQIDGQLDHVESGVSDQMASDAADVNALLEEIASLNKQIGEIEVYTPRGAVDLRDDRQAALEKLAGYISFTSSDIPDSYGAIQLATKDDTGADVVLVNLGYVYGSMSLSGDDVEFSGSTIDLTGGSLYGYQQAKRGAIADFKSSLDNLSNQLVTSVNAAYNPTSGPDNFFDPAGITAGTIALASSLNSSTLKSTDTTNAGANELAKAIHLLKDHSFSVGSGDSINGRFIDHLSDLTADMGQRLRTVSNKLEHQDILESMLLSQRDAYGGVSSNEEMADLIRSQRTYQAIAKIMSITDDLLNTVINGIVR